MNCQSTGKVAISAPARIHVNSIEMTGTLGRFGIGLGFAIEEPRIAITLEKAESDSVSGDFSHLIRKLLRLLREAVSSEHQLSVTCHSGIPVHCGLGSETMLSLSIGQAYATLCGSNLAMERLASILRCSVHSGVGLCAYNEGGFTIDSGYTRASLDAGEPVARLVRLAMPLEWRVILVRPPGSGFATRIKERRFWERRDTIPEEETAKLARATISLLLPSILHEDFDGFCKAFSVVSAGGFKRQEISRHGEHVEDSIKMIKSVGAPVVGMTSGGPTLYTFAPSEDSAVQLQKKITTLLEKDERTEVWITKIDNSGRRIESN